MSKYFNEIQKAQKWAEQDVDVQVAKTASAFETVKEAAEAAEGVRAEISRDPLEKCRKFELPKSGNSPVLSTMNGVGQAARESYRALRTRLMRVQTGNGLRSVVVTSSLPGEGKTVTTLNLAMSCCKLHDTRVLVVDGDLRTHGLTRLLGEPSGPGLAEAITGQVPFDEAVQATDQPNLFVLSAGNADLPASELFADARWKELIGWASETFKLILVDSPPILALADFELISANCDGVLMVVRAHNTRREMLQKAATQIEKKKLLGVVFNGAMQDTRSYYPYFNAAEAGPK